MVFGKIYTYPNNSRVQKALIAAKYNNLDVQETIVAIGKDNTTPEFLAKFPLGKVPAFEGADGFTLFESNAIAFYVANKEGTQLLGKNRKESALVQQWVAFADNEFGPTAAAWLYPILGFYPVNEAATNKAKEDVKRTLSALNRHLVSKTFLVGERVTLADIVLVTSLLRFYELVFDPSFLAPFKNVHRWFTTCVNQPHFKSVLGEVKFCEKMRVAAASSAPNTAAPAKETKPAKEAKPAKDANADLQQALDAEAAKPKEKNPLDLLPKSSFVLDEWKRFYSNNDTRPTAVNWFWDKFDAEGYSIFKVDYKYNDELTLVFMSSNLIGGFFQRLDHMRKYLFASLVVLGENNNSKITGYFVVRGSEIPFGIKDTVDYESYNFEKVDPSNAAVRERVNAIFAWDEKIDGVKFADGKIFK
ncbi:Elongation factor 1-gamma [Boothiomyces sp. JEL0866]|nr:Elongation factor 1-gamma [Boothiomyces sp. JEL0866]